MGFTCERKDPGMLQACGESCQALVKLLPIRLPSQDSDKEIRPGPYDVLSVDHLVKFLGDLKKVYGYGLEIPTAIGEILALVFFLENSDSARRIDLEEFMIIVEYTEVLQSILQVLKKLDTLVFCCEDRYQVSRRDEECFSGYTTKFETKGVLKQKQSIMLTKVGDFEGRFNVVMQKWQLGEKLNELKIPQIKIMAKGWHVKQI